MTPAAKTNAIIQEIADAHGVSVDDVKGTSKLRVVTAARREIAKRLNEERGLTPHQIARLLDKDPTSIFHLLGRVKRTAECRPWL